jgi:hypothetical protein
MPPKPAAKTAAKAAAKPAAKPAAAKPAAAAPKKAAAPAGNGVYVKGLGDASVQDATAIFGAAGKVTDVRLRRNKYAIVHFDNAAAVKRAVDTFNNKDVKGNKPSVVAAKSGPKADKHVGSSVVFVSPLFRQGTSKKQVRELFAPCGKIAKVHTYRNNFAFIYFADAAAAQKAIKDKNGATFNGKKLLVKASVKTLAVKKANQKK